MKTRDLKRKKVSLDQLLKLASKGSVRIVTAEGHAFVLEGADEFDKEVQILGKSRKFQRFLKLRSKKLGSTTLDEYRRSLE